MDKNTVIGLLLIVAVLIGFSYYSSSNQPQPTPAAQTAAQQTTPTDTTTAQAQPVAPVRDTMSLFCESIAANVNDSAATDSNKNVAAGTVTLKNNNVEVVIDKRGGVISDVYLTGYKSYEDFHADKAGAKLHLYDHRYADLNFELKTATGIVNTKEHVFEAVNQKDSTAVTMQLTAKSGETFSITYKLREGDNYMLDVAINSNGLSRYVASGDQKLNVSWHQKIAQHEKGYDFENQYSTITYKLTGEGTEKLNETGDDSEHAEGAVDWVAFKNQYFSTVLIAPSSEFADANFRSHQITQEEETGFLKDYNATMSLPFDASGAKATQLQFYFGPNSFNLLKSMDKNKLGSKDYDLEELVYLGWPIVRWINRFFTIYVFDFLTKIGLPMGIVLLLITLLLRVIVYVPTKKSFMSSAKMRVLKPKVDEINKKYPNQEDAMKKQQEMMTLYSQYGVSPMGGCLPMLIQMPIWIAMFNFVPNAIELRQQGFLWADDLSTYDSIWNFGTHIWGIGDHLSLFCLLFCGTNLIYSFMSIRQQRESMSGEQAQQMKVMQWMMYAMPFMFFFMFNRYSAGLNYYYFISLLASALTMWYLRRTTDDKKLLAKLEANYRANKNDPNKKPKGLAARLEALNKQAALMDEQRKRKQ